MKVSSDKRAQASRTTAITALMSTQTMITTCIQIQTGDTPF
jgi:hypothetical protein